MSAKTGQFAWLMQTWTCLWKLVMSGSAGIMIYVSKDNLLNVMDDSVLVNTCNCQHARMPAGSADSGWISEYGGFCDHKVDYHSNYILSSKKQGKKILKKVSERGMAGHMCTKHDKAQLFFLTWQPNTVIITSLSGEASAYIHPGNDTPCITECSRPIHNTKLINICFQNDTAWCMGTLHM